MTAALPYHSTNEFVRLVQVMRLEGSRLWGFLAPMQQSGAAMPREVLVQRCVNDRVSEGDRSRVGAEASEGACLGVLLRGCRAKVWLV